MLTIVGFQEQQRDCFFVAKTGISWALLNYTIKLRVWQEGVNNNLAQEFTMVAYTGTPANLTYAQASTRTAFANGDGEYSAMWVAYDSGGGIIEALCSDPIDVKVRANLPIS